MVIIELTVKSGTAQGKAQIMEKIQRGVDRAAKLGVAQTVGELLPKVAYKKGRLTSGVQKMLKQQVAAEKGKRRVTIKFKKELVIAKTPKGHNYAPYHMYPGGIFGKYYYHPTTPATAPIGVAEWNRRIYKNTTNHIPGELIKQGLVVVSKGSVK